VPRFHGGLLRRIGLVAVLALMPAWVAGQSAYVPPPPWAVGGSATPAPAPKPAAKVVKATPVPSGSGIPAEQRECRYCHEFTEAEIDIQPKLARKKHRRALEKEKACDQCHDAEEMCCHELVFGKLEDD